MFGGVAEFGRGGLEAKGAGSDGVGDLPERDDHPYCGQLGERFLEERAAGGDFDRFGLVGGGQAFDRVEDNRAAELEAVPSLRSVSAFALTIFGERRVKQVARIIAGERAPGAVGAMLAGRKADDRQPCLGVTERRHRRVPPIGMLGATFAAKPDQARTQGAVARRLGLRYWGKVGGFQAHSSPYRSS